MRRSPVRALGGRPRAGPLFRGCLETSPPAERVRAGARKDRGVVGWKEDRVKVSLGIDVACRADHLDSRVLARLPLLHPEGLESVTGPTPADPFRRAVRRRTKLVKARTAVFQRLDALVELLGPAWADALGEGYSKSALVVLERWADPRALRRLGRRRLTDVLVKASRGAWREPKADELLAAA